MYFCTKITIHVAKQFYKGAILKWKYFGIIHFENILSNAVIQYDVLVS